MSQSIFNQRWWRGRDSYRPPDEPIRSAEYDVAALADGTQAKAFVLDHHYSGSYPAARWRFGLFHHGRLSGVAVFSHPCNDRVLHECLCRPAHRRGRAGSVRPAGRGPRQR